MHTVKRLHFFRYISPLALLIMLVAMLAACGGSGDATGNGDNKGPFTIGVSNGFVGSEWRTQMIQDLQSANAEYMKQGLTKDLVIQSADTDVPGQIQQIRNLINKGVDAIIVDPNSVSGLDGVFKEAKNAGITVISVDQAVTSPDVTNVVIDQTEWARMSAKWLAEQLKGKGNIVVVNGIKGHPANEARYNGVKEVLAQYPGIKVVNEINADWDQAKGQQKMSDVLASQPNIDAVWSQDGMALGVLQALEAANLSKLPIVVGEARAGYMQLWQQVKSKHSDFLSYGVVNPPGAAVSGLRVALQLLQGKHFKADALQGTPKNTLFVPIPGKVDPESFESEFAKVKDKPASYCLDGYISDDEAKSYFS
ncbi:ABC transporter substrate-binding protein [Ktedonospora formicarum]|uniref:Sugar ABC transporter substrate-binding protein n=1 Tax=Ktedonospora formicarum TaxID=2778364 RepID=A0A8J3I3F5_9CHLR|nr:ABC transporter substrate-binding protein [Ktedonospora formicarum]GHO48066.1 sugar ABC transporter substrate-binding protein [Ktedonospora formicarum]